MDLESLCEILEKLNDYQEESKVEDNKEDYYEEEEKASQNNDSSIPPKSTFGRQYINLHAFLIGNSPLLL
jgi:hypothetical protein